MNKFFKIIFIIIVIFLLYIGYHTVPIIMDTYKISDPSVLCLPTSGTDSCPTITVTERVTLYNYFARR